FIAQGVFEKLAFRFAFMKNTPQKKRKKIRKSIKKNEYGRTPITRRKEKRLRKIPFYGYANAENVRK
ncbi:MAG: hypothetical protein RI894_1998, partial [Bacteroidota bacterium]